MGRTLQKAFSQKQQAVLMMPILEGLDGIQKMSKSLNNYVGVTDKPLDMFGKILSINDELMFRYFELLSDKSLKEIDDIKEEILKNGLNPKKVKEELAAEIVSRFHEGIGAETALEFERVFKNRDIPTDIKEVVFKEPLWVCKALLDSGLANSTSQAKRDIQMNGVSINKEKINDDKMILKTGEHVIQKGKKSFVKIIIL